MVTEFSQVKSRELDPVPLQGFSPPFDKSLEEVVLGSMMLERDATQLGLELIPGGEFFYLPAHQKVYEAIVTAHQEGNAVDISTVVNAARQKGTLSQLVGGGCTDGEGAHFIMSLTLKVNSSANLERHIRILMELFIKRRIMTSSRQMLQRACDSTEDVFEVLAQSQAELMSLNDLLAVKQEEHVLSILYRNLQDIEAKRIAKGITGIASCCQIVTKLTGGWQPSDLIIMAARPGMGKTAYALAEARHAAIVEGSPVGIFSLEMGSSQLVNRFISAETDIPFYKIRKPSQLSDGDMLQLTNRTVQLAKAPIYIDDTAGLTIQQFRAKATKMKAKYGIKMLIVDYLQLMKDKSAKGNREQEIASISRELKIVAKELDVPVIALAQLSRAVETRGGDKKPQLSDLRESGAIEQDADIIIFLYRREYYEKENTEPEYQNKLELIIAKHRNGELDDLIVEHRLEVMQFGDVGTLGLETHFMDNAKPFPEAHPYHSNSLSTVESDFEFNNPPEEDPF